MLRDFIGTWIFIRRLLSTQRKAIYSASHRGSRMPIPFHSKFLMALFLLFSPFSSSFSKKLLKTFKIVKLRLSSQHIQNAEKCDKLASRSHENSFFHSYWWEFQRYNVVLIILFYTVNGWFPYILVIYLFWKPCR